LTLVLAELAEDVFAEEDDVDEARVAVADALRGRTAPAAPVCT
jgi:hypothetical protein